ncbi:MAG: hypothetical protein IKL52_06165 [Candidatus Gastranaerophilales bacterium]|nr:hypothetical protein [Candidatus Gastranaerophilales bacterium]
MKKLFLILFLNLFLCANATTFDFQNPNNSKSNEIIRKLAPEDIINEKTQIISHFYDINNDGKDEIIGIIKAPYFYSLEGYKLFALKQKDSSWEIIKSDVYFDNNQDIKIKNKKITYHKTIFYKNKKCKARIKKDKIVSSKSLLFFIKNKKVHDIEEITKFQETNQHNDFELENFHAHKEKTIDVHYNNLSPRTKHYLDLK